MRKGKLGSVSSMSHTILSHIHNHPSPYPQQFSWLLNAKLKIKCDASQESQLTTLISNYVYRKHLITQVPKISRLWNQQFRIGLAHSTAGVTSRVCHNPSGVCLHRGLYFFNNNNKKCLLVSQVLKIKSDSSIGEQIEHVLDDWSLSSHETKSLRSSGTVKQDKPNERPQIEEMCAVIFCSFFLLGKEKYAPWGEEKRPDEIFLMQCNSAVPPPPPKWHSNE